MRFPPICALAAALALAQCAPSPPHDQHVQTSIATPSPTASVTAMPTAAPAATASAALATVAPSIAPSAIPSASPAATAAAATVEAPEILAINIDRTVVRAGDVVSGSVITSLNVASVEAQIATFNLSVPKVSPGVFSIRYSVPEVPLFLRHSYPMVVMAHSANGRTVRKTVQITIR